MISMNSVPMSQSARSVASTSEDASISYSVNPASIRSPAITDV